MRRVAALSTFLLLVAGPATALADLIWDEPPDEKSDTKKPAEPVESSKGCSASYQDMILGVAALALLISGFALRRRVPPDNQPAVS